MNEKTSPVCTIYLVRHGETDYNVQKKLQGHIDVPLNATGKQQARVLAQRLADVHFDVVYASDLLRAKETAEIVAMERQLEVNVTKILRERSFGVAEGRSRMDDEELKDILEKFSTLTPDKQWRSRAVSGWETSEELVGRVFTYLRALALQHLGKNVLVVTHGTVIITLLAHLGYIDLAQVGFGRLGNGAFVELQSDGIDFTVKRTEGLNLPSTK